MIAALEGIDVLAFTGGVGERVPAIRARLCQSFGFLGLKLDESTNARVSDDQEISASHSTVQVLIIHTEEDWEIARSCWQIAAHLSEA